MAKTSREELCYERIITRASPRSGSDIATIMEWMAAENRRACDAGIGSLYSPLERSGFSGGIRKRRLLFFYLGPELLGFVRVSSLAKGCWEIMSAISCPKLRKLYTGFNLLFQQQALLRIEELDRAVGSKTAAVYIVTYHPAVAESIRKMTLASRPFQASGRRFDFSRCRELPEREIALLGKILGNDTNGGQRRLYVFELKDCLEKTPATTFSRESFCIPPQKAAAGGRQDLRKSKPLREATDFLT